MLLKNEMHFIFHIKVVYNKLQFIGLMRMNINEKN